MPAKRRRTGYAYNDSTPKTVTALTPKVAGTKPDGVAEPDAVYARLIAQLGPEGYHELRKKMLDLAA